MKKLVLFFAVACAVSLAACNNKPAEATEEVVDSVAVAVEAVSDSCACDSCVCDSCEGACPAEVVVDSAAVVE